MRRLSQLAACGAAIVFIALGCVASAQDKGAGGGAPPAGYPIKPVRMVVPLAHDAVVGVIRQPQVRARFAAQGLDVHGTGSEEFAAYLKAKVAKWSGVIQVAGLNAN